MRFERTGDVFKRYTKIVRLCIKCGLRTRTTSRDTPFPFILRSSLATLWSNQPVVLSRSHSKINEVAILYLPFLLLLSLSIGFSLPDLASRKTLKASCSPYPTPGEPVTSSSGTGPSGSTSRAPRRFYLPASTSKQYWLSCPRPVTSARAYTRNTRVSRRACLQKKCWC